jgi:hypothetical protein
MEADMDELSEQAKAFLALAKREQEPTAENMERVHRRVLGVGVATATTLVVAKASASSEATAAAHGILSSAAAKLVAGAIALSLVGAGVWSARREPVAPQRALDSAPHAPSPPVSTEVGTPQAEDSLPDELALLQRAEDALVHGDVPRALSVLAQHRQRFAVGRLVEGRDALELLAQCSLGPDATRARAARFIADHPQAMLNLRLRRACGVE